MRKIKINKKILIFQIKDRDLFTTLNGLNETELAGWTIFPFPVPHLPYPHCGSIPYYFQIFDSFCPLFRPLFLYQIP